MIIGVVSDTHLPRFGRQLPKALVRGLQRARVDLIAHCGDLTEALALELFREIAPVVAVAGNNDGNALHKELGERKIIDAGDAMRAKGARRRIVRSMRLPKTTLMRSSSGTHIFRIVRGATACCSSIRVRRPISA